MMRRRARPSTARYGPASPQPAFIRAGFARVSCSCGARHSGACDRTRPSAPPWPRPARYVVMSAAEHRPRPDYGNTWHRGRVVLEPDWWRALAAGDYLHALALLRAAVNEHEPISYDPLT